MIAYYGSQLSPHMTQTPEGFLICRDVPIARIGTQDYLARELGLDGEPDRPVTVERRPEDVFDPAAIASFEGKDVTYTYPSEISRIPLKLHFLSFTRDWSTVLLNSQTSKQHPRKITRAQSGGNRYIVVT